MRSNVIQLVILNKIRHTIGESLCWLPKCRGDYHSTQLYHQGVTLLVTEKWGDYQLNYKTVLNSWALRESVMCHVDSWKPVILCLTTFLQRMNSVTYMRDANPVWGGLLTPSPCTPPPPPQAGCVRAARVWG